MATTAKPSRRKFLHQTSTLITGAGLLPTTLAGCARARTGQSSRPAPNVIFVFADQLRAQALGCMGNSHIRTPNIDRLAEEGILLTRAYSATPVCTPYRAQLMTGRYGHKTGCVDNNIQLPYSETTIGEVFRDQGYATGYIGKWHLDGGMTAPVGSPRRMGYVPQGAARQGFEYWAARECSHNYFETHYFTDSKEPIPVRDYEPTRQTDLAIDFCRAHRQEPFFLMLSWGPPHNPYQPPREWDIYDPDEIPLRPNVPESQAAEARRKLAQYYGLTSSLDAEMGRLMEALDTMGIADDTILCFSSDHGDMLYSHKARRKRMPHEESAHIPFIVRYPRELAAGRREPALFSSVDVMPTLLGLVKLPIPRAVQGRNLAPLLRDESEERPDSIYLQLPYANRRAIRNIGGWRAVIRGPWKYVQAPAAPDGEWLLFNLERDPYELNNLVRDPDYAEQRRELARLLEEWVRKTDDRLDLEAIRQEQLEWLEELEDARDIETDDWTLG